MSFGDWAKTVWAEQGQRLAPYLSPRIFSLACAVAISFSFAAMLVVCETQKIVEKNCSYGLLVVDYAYIVV